MRLLITNGPDKGKIIDVANPRASLMVADGNARRPTEADEAKYAAAEEAPAEEAPAEEAPAEEAPAEEAPAEDPAALRRARRGHPVDDAAPGDPGGE